jgi:hypothetical protein
MDEKKHGISYQERIHLQSSVGLPHRIYSPRYKSRQTKRTLSCSIDRLQISRKHREHQIDSLVWKLVWKLVMQPLTPGLVPLSTTLL